jgi:hypothetical protein
MCFNSLVTGPTYQRALPHIRGVVVHEPVVVLGEVDLCRHPQLDHVLLLVEADLGDDFMKPFRPKYCG